MFKSSDIFRDVRSPADLGDTTILAYMVNHVCSAVCERLGLKGLDPSASDDDRATSTVSTLLTMPIRQGEYMAMEIEDSEGKKSLEYVAAGDNDWNEPFGLA